MLVVILKRPGKKSIRSMEEVTLGGCFGLDGKWTRMAAKHARTNPASKTVKNVSKDNLDNVIKLIYQSTSR